MLKIKDMQAVISKKSICERLSSRSLPIKFCSKSENLSPLL
jgi:hypothetical protein